MALTANHPLLVAADDLIDGLPGRALQNAYDELSRRYRAGTRTLRLSSEDVHAYVAARLPATLAATMHVLEELRRLRPDWRPRSSLDLGSGPGTATWAAATIFETLQESRLVDVSPEMARVASELSATASSSVLRNAETVVGDATSVSGEADLVIVSYLLGELPATDRVRTVERAWAATAGCMVIVENGTPAGYHTIIEARDRLIRLGSHLLAPCPHEHACPLGEDDWCHFSARVPRSAVHRSIKRASRSFEDEKFSYLVVCRDEVAPVSRIIRRPLRRSGYVRLTLCRPDGVTTEEFSRRQGPTYQAASRLEWGDEAPEA